MPTFETERLILRRFTLADADALHREIYADPEVVAEYNGGKTFEPSEVRETLLPRRIVDGQLGYWAVSRREGGAFLGQVHLDAYINTGWYVETDANEQETVLQSPLQLPEVYLGCAFGRQYWGNGYAAEACRALLHYAFKELRIPRLVGGTDRANARSTRLQERLGFRLIPQANGHSFAAVLENPLADYALRSYAEADRDAANALGTHVIDWWFRNGLGTALHRVAIYKATGEIVAHLQATDRSLPLPTRRPGQIHFFLDVAPAHRRRGIASALYAELEDFAKQRQARLLYTEFAIESGGPALAFLTPRGFELLERFWPSSVNLVAFEPERFADYIRRIEEQGIQLTTYAEQGDTPENRRRLYELEQSARASQPFREVGPYAPPAYEQWESDFDFASPDTIFLALAPTGEWIGVVTGLEWYFTGVAPDWRGRGIATALKVRCLTEAKQRGLTRMETENHEDNAAMLAVNQRLGFVYASPGVAYIKRLQT